MNNVDKQLLDSMKIGLIRSNNCSRQQGQVERLLQTVRGKILKILDKDTNLNGWAEILNKVAFAINSAPHAGLGWLSPCMVEYRRAPGLLIPIIKSENERDHWNRKHKE